MLDNKKIKMMTELAVYEKNNRERVFRVNDYFRFDYIAGQLFSAFIRYTLCCLVVFGFYVLFRADELFYNINVSGLTDMLKRGGWIYLIGLAAYLIIALIVYSVRYSRADKGITMYAAGLRKLGRRYYYDISEEP